MNFKVLLGLFFLINFNALSQTPVFEKVSDSLIPTDIFSQEKWKEDWTWNKQNNAFSVSSVDRNNSKVLSLEYSAVTGRGQISSSSFTVPAGASLKVSLSAKPQNYDGGIWVNLEQPNEKPISEQAEFFLAGGSSDWVNYEHRIKVMPKDAVDGKPVKLKLWFYMYGKGEILLDNLKVEIITEDLNAKDKWLQKKINQQSDIFGRLEQQFSTNEKTYTKLIKLHSQKLSKSDSWGILATDSLARVHRNHPFYQHYTQSIKLEMVRHEFEGSQICLFANQGDLKDVSISISDLEGPGKIDKSNVEVLPIAYGNSSKMPDLGFFNGRKSEWLPDALLSKRTFNVEEGKIQPVYLRFYVPKNSQAGLYKATVLVKTNQGQCKVPVELKVYDYTLPVHLTLKTMLLGGKGAKKEDKSYLDLALQNRIGPGTIFTGMSWQNPNFPRKGKTYDFSDVEKRLQFAIDNGLNSFAMCTTPKSGKFGFPKQYSPEWKKKMTHIVKEYSAFLEKKGWLEMAYYYNIDEPWDTRWEQVKDLYSMVKNVNPKIKVLSCVNKVGALEALKDHADVFDVYMQQYHRQQGDARKKDGKEMWWAICIWPDEKPNIFLSSPLSEARMIGWISFAYGIDGFEYWNINSWTQDWKRGLNTKPPQDESWMQNDKGYLISKWPYPVTRAGNGYLTYPGNNNKALNSLRFEALRDGLEEHELLTALKKKGLSKQVDALLKKMIQNVHVFDQNPETVLNSRKVLLDLLEK